MFVLGSSATIAVLAVILGLLGTIRLDVMALFELVALGNLAIASDLGPMLRIVVNQTPKVKGSTNAPESPLNFIATTWLTRGPRADDCAPCVDLQSASRTLFKKGETPSRIQMNIPCMVISSGHSARRR